MGAPTLHEIAAMPFPASVEAMRKYYEPHWGKEKLPEGTKFRVKGDWTISGRLNEIVEAGSAEEAEDLAKELVLDDAHSGLVEIDYLVVEIEP